MSVFAKFPRVFWVANTMELFERWAWYGVFNVLALYLTGSTDEGALGFSQTQKGDIMGIVTAILYFLPIFTGTIADKFGYRKVLLVSFSVLSTGYFLMGKVTSYGPMFWVFTYVAVGAALFKPVISATIAKSTDESTSSIGFGVFYMMVNVGGFLGPFFSSTLRNMSWSYVFLMATVSIVLNLFIVLFLYKEPKREPSNESVGKALLASMRNIVVVLADWRYTLFLVIMIGFWTMFNQLFYTLPNFIEQWVDTAVLLQHFHAVLGSGASVFDNGHGHINPEMLVNFDAAAIVLFQVIVSAFVMRFRPLHAMMGGILVATMGVSFAFAFQNGLYVWVGILVFAFGEMGSSPKFSEYVGRIAPSDKTALYMGTSFLPIAAGNYFAGVISGRVYQGMSDKYSLLQRELAERHIDLPAVSDTVTLNDYYASAAEALQLDAAAMTRLLWEKYHPSNIWYLFAAIGGGAVVALWMYDRWLVPNRSTRQ